MDAIRIRKYQRDFYIAAKRGNLDSMKNAWNNASQYININHYDLDDRGLTALHFVCSDGCKERIKFLIDRGANVNSIDNNGRTPIFCAYVSSFYRETKNSLACVKLLIDARANVNHQDEDGNTLLHYSIAIGIGSMNKDILSVIIQAGASIDIKNNKGETFSEMSEFKQIKNFEEVENFIMKEYEDFMSMQIKTPE